MKKILSLIILLFVVFQSKQLFAQQKKRCGTKEYMARLMAEDPTLKGRLEQSEQLIEQAAIQNQTMRTADVNVVITVPVVFHILYHNTAQNISLNRIMDQLNVLNKDFAHLNADTNNTPVAFRPMTSNTQIQFCLAQRDSAGNPTNGIIRTSVTATGFDPLSNDDAKFTSQGGDNAWPRAKYLNIWVVNWSGQALSFGLLGITQSPGGGPYTDGVMVLYTTVGGPAFHGTEPSYNLGRTLTHEVGHWFSLKHTWGDDGSACTGTDNVTDTPNQASENYGCPPFPTTDNCTSATPGVMFMNYMDYTDDNCMNMFTAGQSTRMHNSITALRPTIPTSNGCSIPTGVNELNSSIVNFSIYPNPASGNITVSGEFIRNTDVIIVITNMIGEIVYTKEFKNVSDVKLPVDLSDKAEGVYNLSLRTTTALVNKKITLTH